LTLRYFTKQFPKETGETILHFAVFLGNFNKIGCIQLANHKTISNVRYYMLKWCIIGVADHMLIYIHIQVNDLGQS